MSSKYEFDFDPASTNTSHGLVVGLIPPESRVLDVGCAAGYLGDALSEKQCTVHGVELDPEAAEAARARLASVVVANAETLDYAAAFGADSFDVIVLADILEHCVNPANVLEGVLAVLSEAGSLVISIPNVGHGSLRLGLLQGRWNYTPLGLLDETHLRFFTWDTLQELLISAGLTVSGAWMTTADPLATEVQVDAEDLPDGLADWVRTQPLALGYQFVMTARRTLLGENASRREPIPAGPAPTPPPSQRLLSAREKAAQLTSDLVQLNSVLAQVRSVLDDRDDELLSAKEIITLHEATILDLLGAQRRLQSSATWRVGSAALAPGRFLRRLLRRSS